MTAVCPGRVQGRLVLAVQVKGQRVPLNTCLDGIKEGAQCHLSGRGLPWPHPEARPGAGVHRQGPGDWVSAHGAQSGSA